MRLFKDFYVYPWTSYQENNCNTIFIDGPVPTLIDPGHSHLFSNIIEGMAKDGKSADAIKLIICTHGHQTTLRHQTILTAMFSGLSAVRSMRIFKKKGKNFFSCQMPNTKKAF